MVHCGLLSPPLAPVEGPQLKLPLSVNRGQFLCPLSVTPLMGKMQNRDLISGLGALQPTPGNTLTLPATLLPLNRGREGENDL